jgi:uncharacterized protein YxeA
MNIVIIIVIVILMVSVSLFVAEDKTLTIFLPVLLIEDKKKRQTLEGSKNESFSPFS